MLRRGTTAQAARARWLSRAVVAGVAEGERLKLRAGPGTDFRVIVGLPGGTALVRLDCRRVGGTPRFEVRLAGVGVCRVLSGSISDSAREAGGP